MYVQTLLKFPLFQKFPSSLKSAWGCGSRKVWHFMSVLTFLKFRPFLKCPSSFKSPRVSGSENVWHLVSVCLSLMTFSTVLTFPTFVTFRNFHYSWSNCLVFKEIVDEFTSTQNNLNSRFFFIFYWLFTTSFDTQGIIILFF